MMNSKWMPFVLTSSILLIFAFAADDWVSLQMPSYRSTFLDLFFSLITNIGVILVFMFAIPSLVAFQKDKRPFRMLLIAFVVSLILSISLKMAFARERPFSLYSLYIFQYSFPSLHSMMVFTFLPILLKYIHEHHLFWITSAFLVGLSRIYFGFHYLSDVVFGAIFGYVLGSIIMHYCEKSWKKTK